MAGGKYDLLVHFLYSWSTYVCASLLPWLDEQKREAWINYWPPRCPCGWDYSGSKLAVDMVLNIVHCRVTSSCIWHDMLIWFKFHFVPLLAAPRGGGVWFHLEPYTFSSWERGFFVNSNWFFRAILKNNVLTMTNATDAVLAYLVG